MTGELIQLIKPVTATQGAARAEAPSQPARAAPAGDDAAKKEGATGAANQPGAPRPGVASASASERPERDTPQQVRNTRLQVVVGNDGIEQVKVLDSATDKVVLEVPPEELVDFAKRMKQYIGLLFDRTA